MDGWMNGWIDELMMIMMTTIMIMMMMSESRGLLYSMTKK